MVTFREGFISTTTVFCFLLPLPAVAQTTGQDVWGEWQRAAETAGYQISVGDTTSGGTQLVLSDVIFQSSIETATVEVNIEEIRFADAQDGTVNISMSPQYTARVDGTNADGQSISLPLVISAPNLSMTARRDGGAISYDTTASSIGLALDDSADERFDGLDIDVTVLGVESTTTGVSTSSERMEQDLLAKSMAVNVDFVDPDNPANSVDLSITLSNLSSLSVGPFEALAAFSGAQDLIASGAITDGRVTYEDAEYRLRAQEGNELTTMDLGVSDGAVAVRTSGAGIEYEVQANGVALTATSPQSEMGTFGFTADEAGWAVKIPFDNANTTGQMDIRADIKRLELPDTAWAQFDPFGSFPRSPASLSFDFGLSGELFASALDFAMGLSDGPPAGGQTGRIEIRDLNLEAVDLGLTGTGAFDVTSPTSPNEQPPTPTGKINLQLTGAYALLEKLQSSGSFAQGQLAMVQGMLGFIGRPGPGPDTLISEIEISPSGILANGIPLPFAP